MTSHPFDTLLKEIDEIIKLHPPHQEKLEEMIAEASRLKCGFTMEKGKPGTLRVSPFAPMNNIIVFDMELILGGLGVEDFKPSGLEMFTDDDKFRMDQNYVQEDLRTRALGAGNRGRTHPSLTANSINP